MNLASAVETGAAEYFANTGSFPTTLSAAGISSSPAGKYVSAIALNGAITVTYGNQVNSVVATQTLGLTPYLSPNNDIIWVCGNHTNPTGSTIATGVSTATTSVADKYLPQTCRTGT